MGKLLSGKSRINLRAGENVRYVVPHSVTAGKEVTVSLRVKEPSQNVRLRVGGILSKAIRAVKPSEMVKATITSGEWEKMKVGVEEMVVSCGSRR